MEFNLGILIFGIFLLAIGLIVLAAQMKSKSRNTEPTTARVTSYFISVDIDPDSKSEYPSYFPIVKYQVHGQWYESRSDRGFAKEKYEIGQQLPILYDPENPSVFSIEGDRSSYIAGAALLAFGIGLCVLAFIFV